MRLVLFTGKGGVGKTTVAAGTAALSAELGRKTLVVSTDAAHSLGDALGVDLGPQPTEIGNGLFGMHVDTQSAFETSWAQVQSYLFDLLAAGGVGPVDAAELMVVPGIEDLLALLAVRDAARSGDFEVICVDCAPTAETLRLLRLPDVLGWWLRRLYPDDRRLKRTLRPVIGRATGLPLPSLAVFEAVDRLHRELTDVRALLADGDTSTVRLVLTPERVVVAEARRTLTALSLHGYRVDGVVVNRVFADPADTGDAWRSGWAAAQSEQLAEIDASFADLAQWRIAYGAAEPLGVAAVSALVRAGYGTGDPMGDGSVPQPLSVGQTPEGFALTLVLPFVSRGDLELARSGDDLVVSVGGSRRVVSLPSALRRCVVAGARLADGKLVVRFVPDPERWPRR